MGTAITHGWLDHWLCQPLYLCGIPLTRARCITDPLRGQGRAFIFKHGCSKIVADASVIKRQLVQQNGIDPAKIEVIGSAVDLQKFKPPRDRMKFRRELGFGAETPLIGNIGMIRPDKGQLILVEAAHFVLTERITDRSARSVRQRAPRHCDKSRRHSGNYRAPSKRFAH